MQPWQPDQQRQYGSPQPPPNPYGQQHAPQQPPPAPLPAEQAPRRSQGLAITTVALGVVAVVLAITPLRAVALLVALVAAVLAVIAMVSKSQGGTGFAVAGLVLAMLTLPVAFLMWTWAADSATSDAERQKALQECITKNPDRVLECAGWE